MAIIKIGIILEVIKIKIRLNLLELNKYFIPTKVFSEKIDDICKGQYGVLVEKKLRITIKIRGKNVSTYLFSLLLEKLLIVPIIANMLHGRKVKGIFQK